MSTLSVHLRDEQLNIEFIGRSRLRDLLISHGVNMNFPCGGNGRCGRCTVRLDGKEVSACTAWVSKDADLMLPASASFDSETVSVTGSLPEGSHRLLGAAVDLGTTNAEAELVDLDTGEILKYVSIPNPQGRYGADVISRITAALSGKGGDLKRLSENAVYRLLFDLLGQPEEDPGYLISRMVIAGNTSMLYLLSGRNPECLSHAPFAADHLFGEESALFKIPVYYPPCLHAFVGADIVCALLSSGILEKDETALLADLGTNGEMALYTGGKFWIASASCGPAFDKNDLPGPVLIDAAASFLEQGKIDETGMIEGMERKLSYGDHEFTIEDIRDLQLAKAALSAGIRTLLKAAGCPMKNVDEFCIAGNFGRYLNTENAVRVGLIPRALQKKTKVLGNASLAGAVMLLQEPELRKKAESLREITTHVDLGGNQAFNDLFIRNIGFEI